MPTERCEKPPAQAPLGICAAARALAIGRGTIRRCETQGLLPSARNGQRSYRANDLAQLQVVLLGKRLGLTTAECRALVAPHPAAPSSAELQDSLTAILALRSRLTSQLADSQQMLQDLEQLAAQWRPAAAPTPCSPDSA